MLLIAIMPGHFYSQFYSLKFQSSVTSAGLYVSREGRGPCPSKDKPETEGYPPVGYLFRDNSVAKNFVIP